MILHPSIDMNVTEMTSLSAPKAHGSASGDVFGPITGAETKSDLPVDAENGEKKPRATSSYES